MTGRPPPPRSGPPPRFPNSPRPAAGNPAIPKSPPIPRPSPSELFEDETIARAAGTEPGPLKAPTIALAVSGSIAAYKAAEVARLLIKAGARVLPLMTRSAREFLGAVTLSGITGERVAGEMFDPQSPGEMHIAIAEQADVVLLVPATADLLARLASGRADDLVTALALAARGPVIAAPAMHPRMWSHPATQRNVKTLTDDGRIELVGPVDGEVASGDKGFGRMADPQAIVAAALARATHRDLARMRLVVSAGPTVEDFDPVRFLGNRSTGKMGFAIAERAAARGAEVTLVAGPVTLPTPHGVRRVDVRSALAMRGALWQALGPELRGADALVMAAAVADYRPAEEHAAKVKRTAEPMTLELTPNPDLLAEIGAARGEKLPVLIGFAVETDSDDRVIAAALNKLETKKVDLVVANHARDAFGKDDNRATFVTRGGAEALGVLSKRDLADRLLDRIAKLVRR